MSAESKRCRRCAAPRGRRTLEGGGTHLDLTGCHVNRVRSQLSGTGEKPRLCFSPAGTQQPTRVADVGADQRGRWAGCTAAWGAAPELAAVSTPTTVNDQKWSWPSLVKTVVDRVPPAQLPPSKYTVNAAAYGVSIGIGQPVPTPVTVRA